MSELTPQQRIENAVTYGRACVRIIEATDVLLDREPALLERLLLRVVRKLYTWRLRRLVEIMPSDITQQFWSASDKMWGIERGFSNN